MNIKNASFWMIKKSAIQGHLSNICFRNYRNSFILWYINIKRLIHPEWRDFYVQEEMDCDACICNADII